jgi:hypothetical protein
MEVGQGPNWGCSAKEKKKNILDSNHCYSQAEQINYLKLTTNAIFYTISNPNFADHPPIQCCIVCVIKNVV